MPAETLNRIVVALIIVAWWNDDDESKRERAAENAPHDWYKQEWMLLFILY